MPERPGLLTRDFVVVTLAAAFFMISFGATLPVLPRYVADGLGESDVAVGIVMGATAVSAIVLRPAIGRAGDRRGRRSLLVAGALVTAVGMAAHVPASSVPLLVVARLVVGAGQGALFVGAATLVNDLAPPDQRGQAASYFSVAIYVGLGFGPFLGEWLLTRTSFDAVWWAVVCGLVVSAVVGLAAPIGLPEVDPDEPPPVARTGLARLLHPAAVGPGTVLFLGVVGFVGFNTFVPLHGEEIGLDDVAAVFLLFSFVVLVVRLTGSRLPDAHGPIVIGTVALVASMIGLVGIAAWRAPIGLYVFTVALAVGSALLYPALMAAAVNAAPDNERSSAVATFTMFFEVATALGGAVLGVVASLSSYSGAFFTAALFSLAGLVVLHVRLARRLEVGSPHV
ncbi:MFS transporter [Actinomarinicola tropica]|uniref:MFS transporter n=1 Tax=Actinomarinicola tropica TaxID=2789776 RepID=A0A5Q2RGX2_9ACTN|nr:MFS transporter [Actinomarinicola tropica]QGG96079.1 MFS transporter [Actinomarinicola tropica]